jgi:hypothetical protein
MPVLEPVEIVDDGGLGLIQRVPWLSEEGPATVNGVAGEEAIIP